MCERFRHENKHATRLSDREQALQNKTGLDRLTYAHVIRADEDRVRKLVDDALGGTAEEWLTDRLRTGAVCEPSISSCYRRSEHV